jgi:hypothetical protein
VVGSTAAVSLNLSLVPLWLVEDGTGETRSVARIAKRVGVSPATVRGPRQPGAPVTGLPLMYAAETMDATEY